jgi:hypothetical protein
MKTSSVPLCEWTVEAKPVSYIVGVDETNPRMPVRFLRMSDGTVYRLKHHLARDGNETVESAIKEGNIIRGVKSGIVYRFLAERPYTDPAVLNAAWEASPPPWHDNAK